MLLSSNKYKLWDAKYGYNWIFKKDRTFIEFMYDNERRLKKVPTTDVILDNLSWSCNNDTIFIAYSPKIIFKYPIIKLNKSLLIVKDLQKSWGRDTLIFNIAKIQNVLPE